MRLSDGTSVTEVHKNKAAMTLSQYYTSWATGASWSRSFPTVGYVFYIYSITCNLLQRLKNATSSSTSSCGPSAISSCHYFDNACYGSMGQYDNYVVLSRYPTFLGTYKSAAPGFLKPEVRNLTVRRTVCPTNSLLNSCRLCLASTRLVLFR